MQLAIFDVGGGTMANCLPSWSPYFVVLQRLRQIWMPLGMNPPEGGKLLSVTWQACSGACCSLCRCTSATGCRSSRRMMQALLQPFRQNSHCGTCPYMETLSQTPCRRSQASILQHMLLKTA